VVLFATIEAPLELCVPLFFVVILIRGAVRFSVIVLGLSVAGSLSGPFQDIAPLGRQSVRFLHVLDRLCHGRLLLDQDLYWAQFPRRAGRIFIASDRFRGGERQANNAAMTSCTIRPSAANSASHFPIAYDLSVILSYDGKSFSPSGNCKMNPDSSVL
jgi:hypothetical protein